MKKKTEEKTQTQEERIADREPQAAWNALFDLLLKDEEEKKQIR